MKNILGNSCAKGCMIYFVALIAVVVLTGLGIGARFGAEAQKPVFTPLNVPGEQVTAATPTSPASSEAAPQPDTQPVQPAPQQIAPTPTSVPFSIEGAQQAYGSIQTQIGTIIGEASQPFYVVQPGDTLWDIAVDYGITVDTLKSANVALDEFIKPGDLVYLPQGGQVQPAPQQPVPAPAAPAPAPANTQPGGSIPSMPQTGINP